MMAVDSIACANQKEVDEIIRLLVSRYKVLHPGWELCFLTIKEMEPRKQELFLTDLRDLLRKYEK